MAAATLFVFQFLRPRSDGGRVGTTLPAAAAGTDPRFPPPCAMHYRYPHHADAVHTLSHTISASERTPPSLQAPRNAKVVNNRALNGKLPAQQFDVRVGKDQVSRVTLGFTKSNELFVGRVAMLGFAAAVLGELATGKGALAQFGLETGLPLTDIDGIVAAIAIFNLVAAFLPAKGTLVLDEDEAQDNRKKGVLQDPKINVLQPKKFFGFSGFGFTKDNEVCSSSSIGGSISRDSIAHNVQGPCAVMARVLGRRGCVVSPR